MIAGEMIFYFIIESLEDFTQQHTHTRPTNPSDSTTGSAWISLAYGLFHSTFKQHKSFKRQMKTMVNTYLHNTDSKFDV